MTHVARITVPAPVRWEALLEHLYRSDFKQADLVEDQFAWLIQITSWQFNMNWIPREDILEMALPLDEHFPNMDTSRDAPDYNVGLWRDPVLNILLNIVGSVPPERVRKQIVSGLGR